MAKNLAEPADGENAQDRALAPGGDESLVTDFGRHYSIKLAVSLCPSGWRLPTAEDWDALIDAVGGVARAYDKLIQGGGSRFDALFAGFSTFWGGDNGGPRKLGVEATRGPFDPQYRETHFWEFSTKAVGKPLSPHQRGLSIRAYDKKVKHDKFWYGQVTQGREDPKWPDYQRKWLETCTHFLSVRYVRI